MSETGIIATAQYNSYGEVELERLRVGISSYLDPLLLDHMQVDMARGLASDAHIRISGFIWTQDLGEYNFPIPANWWESFKDALFPDWLKKVFPVRYTDFNAYIKIIYPELHKKLAFPKEQHRIRVAQMSINGIPIEK